MDDQANLQTSYQTFSYQCPSELRRGKGIVELAKTPMLRGRVQIVKEGGENNLHFHRGMDGFWMVLEGRVKFYGPGDVLIGEFGKHEGIMIPAGVEYWFESSGEVPLQILQMAAFDPNVKTARVDAAPQKFKVGEVPVDVITKVAT